MVVCGFVNLHFETDKNKFNSCMKFIVLVSDINECTDSLHNCHADGICTNTNGSFYCTCQVGYTGDGVNCTGNKNLNIYNQSNKMFPFSFFVQSSFRFVQSYYKGLCQFIINNSPTIGL